MGPDRSGTRAIAVCVVALMLIAGCGGISNPTSTPTSSQSNTTSTANGVRSTGTASSTTNTSSKYTRVYRQTIDSVVSIRSVGRSNQGSLGSGFVYRITNETGNGTGYIVTNAHVVGGADIVGVKFRRQGVWRTGAVIGRDVYTDLAVIKVTDPPSFTDALPLATQQPAPGQKVVALGNPYGLTGTITHGIVSAVNRTMPSGAGFLVQNLLDNYKIPYEKVKDAKFIFKIFLKH